MKNLAIISLILFLLISSCRKNSLEVSGDSLPSNYSIAFHVYNDSLADIYSLNINENKLTQLTNSPKFDIFPKYSPDGSKIVFSSDRDGIYSLYIMNNDGSNILKLTTNSNRDRYPIFSPDGLKILFLSPDSGVSEQASIDLINTSGDDRIQLATVLHYDSPPSFSPDGTKIVYTATEDNDTEIYTMGVDGGNKVRLSDQDSYDDFYPKFSPDGSKIVYFSIDRDSVDGLYIMNSNGSNKNLVVELNNVFHSDFQFSPDGRKILFRDAWNINIVNIDGSGRLELDAEGWTPEFSPDGKHIVYVRGLWTNNRDIFLINPDGTNKVNLTNSPNVRELYPTFSPKL